MDKEFYTFKMDKLNIVGDMTKEKCREKDNYTDKMVH